MGTTTISTLVNLINDCPLRLSVTGSDRVSLFVGRDGVQVVLLLDYGGLYTLLELGQDAVAEMDASYASERDQGRCNASSAP
jgi:hypothetical protein